MEETELIYSGAVISCIRQGNTLFFNLPGAFQNAGITISVAQFEKDFRKDIKELSKIKKLEYEEDDEFICECCRKKHSDKENEENSK